jgi:hypothetical protein
MDERIRRYGDRVGYTDAEMEKFAEGGHRVRHVMRLSEAASLYSIEVVVVESRICNSGHVKGQKFAMDVDGNFVTKLRPKKLCVYLVSQLTIPVALINERLNEGLEPGCLSDEGISAKKPKFGKGGNLESFAYTATMQRGII